MPVGLLVGLGMFAAACGGGSSETGGGGGGGGGSDDCEKICTVALSEEGRDPEPGGSIRFGVAAETNNWSPSVGQWAGSGNLISMTFFDRLAMYDDDNVPQPYLAESFESNDTFDEWTIKLRSGIKFHDDTDLDAAAVVMNLEEQHRSLLTGPVFQLIETIEEDTSDPDGLTVKLTMSGPWSTFPHILTAQPGSMAAPAMITSEAENKADNPIGTGPFKFVSWTRENNLVVEKNSDYWREGYPLLDRIEFRVVTDGQARGSSIQSGDLDVMEASEADNINRFFTRASAGEYQIYVATEGDTDENFVMFNTTKPPFDDPVLRRAAIQAIDTEAVNDQVYEGIFTAARGPISPSSEWFVETEYPPFDPGAAKAAIEAWEEANGRGMSFKANVPPDPAILQIAQLMLDLAGDVGVEVELNTMEQTLLILDAITGNYESTGFAQIFNVPHPDRAYAFLHSSSIPEDPLSAETSLNFPRYANGAIDAALDGARATDNVDEQFEYYKELQEALAEDTPYLWLVHVTSTLVARNNVRSLTTWELPDGSTGKQQLGTNVPLYQVWLS